MNDLIVLVADRNMKFAVQGILERNHSLKIRKISYHIEPHIQHDPGIYNTAHNFLRGYLDKYSYALVMLDKEWEGCNKNVKQLEEYIQLNLDDSGWKDRSQVIVIDPELEIWVWSDSPHVASCIGWDDAELRNWLKSNNHILPNSYKPLNPKNVFENALRIKGKQRSSAIFSKLAEEVSFERCTDKSFCKFKTTLQSWFPQTQPY